MRPIRLLAFWGLATCIFSLAATLWAARPAEADIVYDNGSFSGSAGVSFGSSTTADDFVLDADAVLTSMSFDGFHTLGGTLGPTLQWFIFADVGGSPGAAGDSDGDEGKQRSGIAKGGERQRGALASCRSLRLEPEDTPHRHRSRRRSSRRASA